MRKWHRWLSVTFGVFLLWIAVTGVLSQVQMWGEMVGDDHGQQVVPAGFVCPDTMICRPKPPKKSGWNYGLLHHLHSGETFGPLGTLIASLSSLAMVFFSFSGLWVYISMWRNRRAKNHKPGWFWK